MKTKVTIEFTLNTDKQFERYTKNLDKAIDLLVPLYGEFDVKEVEINE